MADTASTTFADVEGTVDGEPETDGPSEGATVGGGGVDLADGDVAPQPQAVATTAAATSAREHLSVIERISLTSSFRLGNLTGF